MTKKSSVTLLGLMIICSFLSLDYDLFAQTRTFYEHEYEITHYSDKEKFHWDFDKVMQAKNGELWMINVGKFYRFDGYSFEEFSVTKSEEDFSAGRQFSDILLDERDNIWLPAMGAGIVKYDPVNQEYTRKRIHPNRLLDNSCGKITMDTLGTIWIGYNEGLIRIKDKQTLDIEVITPQPQAAEIQELIKESLRGELAVIKEVGSNQQLKKEFSITDSLRIAIVAQGELGHSPDSYFVLDNDFVDFGWISNSAGEVIWEMKPKGSLNASNLFSSRLVVDFIDLPIGTYTLHFQTNDTYAYDDWNIEMWDSPDVNNPPAIPEWWGIALYNADKSIEARMEQIIQGNQEKSGFKGEYTDVFKDESEGIWSFGCSLQKIIPIKGGAYQIEDYIVWTGGDSIPWNEVYVLEDKDEHHLWLGGIKLNEENISQRVFGIIDKDNKTFTEINLNLPPEDIITVMKQDNEGNLWLGGHRIKGLHILPKSMDLNDTGVIELTSFNLGRAQFVKSKAVPVGEIKNLELDNANNLWVATWHDYFFKIDLDKPPFEVYDLKEHEKFFDNRWINIYRDQLNDFWITSEPGGMMKYQIISGQADFYKGNFKGTSFQWIYPIVDLSDNKMLFKIKDGIVLYEHKTEQSTFISVPGLKIAGGNHSNFMINDSLLFLNSGQIVIIQKWKIIDNVGAYLDGQENWFFRGAKVSENKFWAGSGRGEIGLFEFEENQFKLIQVTSDWGAIMDMISDQSGQLWVNSVALKTNLDSVGFTKIYTKKDGLLLAGDNRAKLLEDKGGNIWIFGNAGASVLNPKTGEVKTPSKLKNIKTHIASRNVDGTISLFQDNRVIVFDPQNLKIDSIAPIILFKSISFNDKDSITYIDLTWNENQNSLSFAYWRNDLTLEFSGLQFNDSEGITYQYQLQGLSKEWQNVGKEHTARFLNLPHGKYSFHVKAANADGIWSEPKSLSFTILPPWWLTWWAYTIYSLAALALLLWFIQSQRKKVIAKQMELEKEQAFNTELQDINEANQRFVPQDFMQILGKKRIQDLKLGDQTQIKMTILFSDIRSYTMLSETMSPNDNFKFINGYLGRIGPIIKKHGGFIDKYMGDGLMALFLDDHQAAIKAVVEMQILLEEYNVERRSKGRQAIRTGMGLNTGPLMLGIIGDQNRYDSTVIADAVNTASRMEGLTKIFGASIIISEKTLEELRSGKEKTASLPFAYRYLGKVKVKGRDKAIGIYDLYEGDIVSIRQKKAKTQEVFEEGILHYFHRQFGKSAECFKQVLEVNESDLAAQYYLDKSVEYIINEVPETWNGVEEMVMK